MAKAERASEAKLHAGRRLKAARMACGFQTVESLANVLHVGASSLRNWESGTRMPDVLAMLRFATTTRVPMEFIYGGLVESVPFGLMESLVAACAEVGAVINGPVPEFPVATRPDVPSATVPKPRNPGRTIHEPAPLIRPPAR